MSESSRSRTRKQTRGSVSRLSDQVNRHSCRHCWLADARVGVSPLQLGRISLSHTQEHAQPRRRAAAAAAATAIASAINAAAAAEIDLSVERGAVGGACEA